MAEISSQQRTTARIKRQPQLKHSPKPHLRPTASPQSKTTSIRTLDHVIQELNSKLTLDQKKKLTDYNIVLGDILHMHYLKFNESNQQITTLKMKIIADPYDYKSIVEKDAKKQFKLKHTPNLLTKPEADSLAKSDTPIDFLKTLLVTKQLHETNLS